MDYIVESDILEDFLEGVSGARAVLEELSRSGLVYISALCAAELVWAAKGDRRDAAEGLIGALTVVPVGREVALVAGGLRADGGRADYDLRNCIVAANAIELAATLVTRGKRKYPEGACQMQVAAY